MTIYYSNSKQIANKYSLKILLELLPNSFKERTMRYISKEDAYNFVLGRLLLKQGLKDFSFNENCLNEIKKNENGKPEIEGIHFNISHSNNLVACAISEKGAVGIDVEQTSDIDMSHFKTWFTEEEWNSIYAAENSKNRFFWYWRRKESILKALGVPLSFLEQIDLRNGAENTFVFEGQKWFLKELDILNFGSLGLCFFEEEEIELKKFSFDMI